MPVDVVVREPRNYNQFKNGEDFTSNPSDFTLNLTGEVMENVRFTYFIDVSWYSQEGPGNVWNGNASLSNIKKDSGTWEADGFSVGDVCQWLESGTQTAIISLDAFNQAGDTFYYTIISGSISTSNGSRLVGLSYLTASVYKFGIIENQEKFNSISKITGEDQGYYAEGIGAATFPAARSTNWVSATKLGTPKSWVTGDLMIRFNSNPSTGVQRFEVQHDFTIPYYKDGEISNLQDKLATALFSGSQTLKYSFSAGFRTFLSNPNTEKEVVVDNILGSVGWYEEPFNGFANNYKIVSTTYNDDSNGANADGILISSKTNVTIEVEKTLGNFTAGERAGVYLSYLPKVNEYQNTINTDLKENFIYDSSVNNEGLIPSNGQDFIQNFEITNLVGNTMTLTFDVDYSFTQQLRLASNNSQSPVNFVLGVQLGDVSKSSGNSDRVMLIGDVNVYDIGSDIPDLMEFTKFDIYTPEKLISGGLGTTDATLWNEDDVAIDYSFTLDTNKDAVLNSLSFKIIAYDPITSHYFEIDNYPFNIFPSVTANGVQQLNANTTRGYSLDTTDQFNKVDLLPFGSFAGINVYNGIIGQKISWQDWVSNLGVDNNFYDITKTNNNLNNKTSNYSLLNGYEIRFAFLGELYGTNSLGVSGLTDYIQLSNLITVYDYESFGVWTKVNETFDSTGTTLLTDGNGDPLVQSGKDTLFRSTWTNSLGPVTDLLPLWGYHRIEETGDVGYSIREINTIYDPMVGIELIPKTGTRLDMQIVGGNVVMECLIDGSKIQPNVCYNISSRIGDDTATILTGKRKSPSGDLKMSSGTPSIKQKP